MTYFIFAGDMLVMLFMVLLVVWVSLSSSHATIDRAARIPLEDERRQPCGNARGGSSGNRSRHGAMIALAVGSW